MPRFFTLKEAEDCLPRLEEWLRGAMEAKQEIVAAEKELQSVATRIHFSGGMELNPSDVAGQRLIKEQGIERLKQTMQQIEDAGCLVKDLDIGLIDFPALLDAKEVYLCWKMGEDRITYWHNVDEGFAGRKPIVGSFGEGEGPLRPN